MCYDTLEMDVHVVGLHVLLLLNISVYKIMFVMQWKNRDYMFVF